MRSPRKQGRAFELGIFNARSFVCQGAFTGDIPLRKMPASWRNVVWRTLRALARTPRKEPIAEMICATFFLRCM
ncbi:hypothetical protein AAY81_01225 [Denitrobacterium detoxificans]|nr:hypothetical protein AAY81_01225 [Denitrobacterium detoxificans]